MFQRHENAATLQTPSLVCSADSSLDASEADSSCGVILHIHTTSGSYTTVDVFHAYCALAVVKHRLSNAQCSFNCCREEMNAAEVAGLCRLLLWDEDICQRRSAEELLCIQQQLQTSLSTNTPVQEHGSDPGGEPDGIISAVVTSELSSQMSLLNNGPRTCVKSASMSECDTSADDNAAANIITKTDDSSLQQPGTDWETLPIDIKYCSNHQLPVALLEQEAARLSHLRDSIGPSTVRPFDQ